MEKMYHPFPKEILRQNDSKTTDEVCKSFSHLESLYNQHIVNISQLSSSGSKKAQSSFYSYFAFVYELTQIPKPNNFEEIFLNSSNGQIESLNSKTHSRNSKSDQLVTQTKPEIVHPIDPKPISGDNFFETMRRCPDMIIFRTVLLKIMFNETILREDLLKFSQSKLFNLQKLVFVKFKTVLDIS